MAGRTTGRLLTVTAMALLAALIVLCAYIKPAETLPGGFSDVRVTDSHLPTALDFTPDGRMVVGSKSGQVYLYDKSGNNLAKPEALNLPVCDNSERGLLGVAVDPKFGIEGNDYVYFYYTHKRSACPDKQPTDPRNPYNRVSRFEMDGNTIVKSSEEVLVDGIPSPNGNHNAGDLHFGNDGKLYVSVGDGACDYAEKTKCQYENDASRDGNVLLGKILRINADGSIPSDNPYTGPNSAPCSNEGGGIARAGEGEKCRETFVSGFRNPFRFAIDPDAEKTRLFINDVGGQRWEEVDEAVFGSNGTLDSGNDYGWNVCEGRHDNPYRADQVNCDGATFTGPIHEYNHSTGCESITAGAFVPDDARWPDVYRDAYLYGDFVCGKIFSLTPRDGGGYARTTFAGGLGLRTAVAMDFGPYKSTRQALYYASFEDGGMIRRISYEAGNQDPVAALKTTDGKNYSPDPTMSLDASGSTDAENQPLTYEWDFEEGTADNKTTPTPTTSYTYEERGEYDVTVTVRDSTTGVSDPPARMTVYPGNTPPDTPSITSPADESTFTVPPKDGETAQGNITAIGSATDPDRDAVTLEWEVVQHHDANHDHPYASGTGGTDEPFTFPGAEPEGLYSTDPDGNYLELRLTARDELGLASEPASIEIRPQTVDLRFVPNPSDLKIRVNGKMFKGPDTLRSWVGYDLNVAAPRQRDADRRTWAFRSWSDGAPAAHTIDSPPGDTPKDGRTFTANFRRVSR
jgi:glucose/arabinose dehydrogenase